MITDKLGLCTDKSSQLTNPQSPWHKCACICTCTRKCACASMCGNHVRMQSRMCKHACIHTACMYVGMHARTHACWAVPPGFLEGCAKVVHCARLNEAVKYATATHGTYTHIHPTDSPCSDVAAHRFTVDSTFAVSALKTGEVLRP